ncbi:uncharacterized protein LOC125769806 [Anopheles funestus]|uniref:uncharacterized protein LOC125769806 n=1 Tax=Anopheles funestus TaxID=62324 RepID=UPI0020C63CC8|nr:uncharacterized protein LOC125769806 [Anopheles funestus]
MSQEYAQHVLKVAVAQICRTIGWHSTHASTMDLLIDVTQHFLREISRIMHRYCELYNRTEANLDDLALAYKEIGINLDELMEYVQFVDPIPLTLEVPRFPLPKESSLNFLKPGSREVLTRPVHIPEYMPPLMFETEDDGTERSANDDERRAAFGDAKSLLNSAAIAIASVAATISCDARAITDGGSSGIGVPKGPVTTIEEVSSTGEGVDDGSNLPHAVINEEVEIPMQTIEVKEQPTSVGDEETATVSKRADDTVKEKPPQVDDATPGGTKNVITAEEGRPTREISSVIMTTSGFISPAREGKLPESRIPIIPEERPIQQPTPTVSAVPALAAAHLQMALPPGTSVPGVPALAGSAPVSSAALLASAAGSYFPKPNATDGTVGVGLPPGTQGSIGLGAPTDPSQPPPKAVGEKPTKKVKKKPVDREKKKAEKGLANAARKLEKQVAGEKGGMVKQPPVLEAPFAPAVKEETDFTTPLPPDALVAGRVTDNLGLVSNPFFKNSSIKPEGNDGVKPMDGVPGFGLLAPGTVPGKPAKPAKVKVVKEKAVKKRKSAAPKQVPVPGEMLMDDPANLNRQLPIPNFLPFPTPKPKKVSKASKKAANQRGQFDAVELPPPLIGPLGLGTSVGNPTLVGPLSAGPMQNVKPEHLFGMMPNAGIGSPTTAALSLPLKKPPVGAFKQEEHEVQHGGSNNPLVDQAAQLNLLQKMHPSLEITASPSITTQEMHEKPLTPGRMLFDGKGMKQETANDRDVIVIDDDKSPPHVATLPVSMTTPTTKKQRKQAAHTNAAAGGVMGMHGQPFGMGPVGGTYDGEYRPDEAIHFSPLANMPKTPDIRLHSSSSTTPSWMNESPRLATPKKTPGTGNLFSDLSSKTLTECMAQNRPQETAKATPLPIDGGKKPKRPKQKPKTDAKLSKLAECNKKLEEANQKIGNLAGQNPFALYPGSMNPFAPDASVYSKFLNQSLQAVAGMRNPMPFGMFPLPSGPGLIPDNPLFPRMPPAYPGQHRPGFQLPPNPFVLPGINPMNLLRMPTLANRLPGMAGMGGPGGNQRDFLDEPLDPETKLAQTPLDLQKSTCNVAPLVPPSLFQSATENMTLGGGSNELLNLSVRSTVSPAAGRDTITTTQTITATKRETSSVTVAATATSSSINSQSIFGTTSSVISTVKEGKPETVRESYKEDQVVILPAASVLPGASPPQRSSMLVVDVDDSDGSQSTAGGKSKDGKRKQKEHKKDRKLKDGKIKKKKDKKDKSKSKDRDREQLKELTAGTATSPGVMTMGMIGAEEALMEQLRKERKEKKEKRKEKMKKEKRKEKERMVAIGGTGGSPAGIGGPAGSVGTSAGAGGQPSGETVPKLMLKIGGSNATQSPRSETPDKAYMEQLLLGAGSVADPKRDGSPELARISALVTRPPKLKGAGGTAVPGKSKKDETGKNVPHGSPLPPPGTEQLKLQPTIDADDTFAALKQSVKVNFATSTVGSTTTGSALVNYATTDDNSTGAAGTTTGRGSKVARLADSVGDPKPFAGGESSKKAVKESKGSKSVHHHHHHHAVPDTYTTPVHMTDVDGNTVWICPACGRVDDGTPMIGCDGCDAWYHWVCVGIQVPPDDNEDWYCRVCIAKKQDTQADEKQRKRKKKDKKTSKE